MNIQSIFLATLKKHSLINKNDRILVALSGGADSVALLHLLVSVSDKLGITVGAAHVNHMLRKTADRDMHFCEKLCSSLSVHLDILKVNIKETAKKEGISEELCARNVRYAFFESLGYDKIATAHNKNDNAETILFNFMRGALEGGLCGIPYMRENIIRPLLDIKKEEIIRFCENNSYDFVTDETNFEEIYTRNKIRLSLIPEIEKNFNGNFINTVTANSEFLSYDEEFLNDTAKKIYDGKILTEFVNKLPPAILSRLIQLYYKERTNDVQNLSGTYIKSIMSLLENGGTGKKADLPCDFEAYISYGKLIIDRKTSEIEFEYPIIPDEPLFISEIGKKITIRHDKNGKISLPDTNGLYVRSKKDGDFFFPSGMQGKKRVSDYFTDKKIPKKARFKIPILTKDGEIVSICGYRNDRRFCGVYPDNYTIFIEEANDAE